MASKAVASSASVFKSLLHGDCLTIDAHSSNSRLKVSRNQSHIGGLPPISSSWRQVPWDPRPDLFQLNICCYSPCVISSLTRGCVCGLQLLLVLVSAVILGSESSGTRDHILLSQIRDFPTWGARFPYLYPPGTGWPSYIPRHWIPFSSPPTTCRATVEVFEPASTWSSLVITAAPRYIASARITQKTPLPTLLLLLRGSFAAIT
jgi:hypothetical protein